MAAVAPAPAFKPYENISGRKEFEAAGEANMDRKSWCTSIVLFHVCYGVVVIVVYHWP